MGHHVRALGLDSPQAPQGQNLDLKERSDQKTPIPAPWGEKTDCLSERLSSRGGIYGQSGL